jgi:hypothetical protein
MGTSHLHLLVGWTSMLLGAISGAAIGLFFHRDEWMGGYGSFRRRMLRLGHISFFGLGILNLMFGLTLKAIPLPAAHIEVASVGFLLGAITMPLCCFLAAWKKPFRHLFPVPVISVMAGIIPALVGWFLT